MYIPNVNLYNGGIFVMPVEIADKHMKMASAAFLKVIIYICRHADKPIDTEEISAELKMDKEDTEDALLYWYNAGVLAKAEEKAAEISVTETEKTSETVDAEPAKPAEKPVVKVKPSTLSYQQICARIAESDEVKFLLSEAQLKLGRTIGKADQSALLNLHDFYGLPAEVILAICEYAKIHGKSHNINYIFTVGADWSNREIDSLEAADEELKKLEHASSVWPDLCRLTGIKVQYPTASQSKYLEIWTNEWKFSLNMVAAAFEEMSKHTQSVSFPYMNKILAKWHSEGIKTPEEAELKQKEFEAEKERKQAERKQGTKSAYGVKKTANEPERQPSYDIDQANAYMQTTVPKYKKKEKH